MRASPNARVDERKEHRCSKEEGNILLIRAS